MTKLKRFITISFLFLLSHTCFSMETMLVPAGQFNINWKSDFSEKEKNKLRDWLSQAAYTASLVGGKFPLPETSVNINKTNRGNSAVPWAHTIRETRPEGVEFHVNPNKSISAFVNDWTAVHEFSHLYIPYPGKRDIWISEGFASYYQNILMARGKVLSERAAWQKLADGFQRGAKDQQPNTKLKNVKRKRTGGTMRIYWSGALYFLEADLNLRSSGQSLDKVVSEYGECCRSRRKYTNGERLVEELDQISNRKIFSTLYDDYANEYKFRDYKKVLARLGIILDSEHKVLLKNDDYHTRLRATFMDSEESIL